MTNAVSHYSVLWNLLMTNVWRGPPSNTANEAKFENAKCLLCKVYCAQLLLITKPAIKAIKEHVSSYIHN